MSKFDGNYPITWILQMDQLFETVIKKLRNQEIMKYLIKWNNLPIQDSTWEESFRQNYQQLLKQS